MLERLLQSDAAVGAFMRDRYLKSPYVHRGGGAALAPLASREAIDRLVEQTACDVLVVREGTAHQGGRPSSAAEAWRLHAAGYTLALRQPDRHDAGFAELARAMSADLHAAVNLHVYCTPQGAQGFQWHYDPEEVFIIQVAGTKEYLGKPNTTHPFPLEEVMFPEEGAAGPEADAPAERWELAPGDWLYLPGGYWHCARATDASVSISLGMMPPTALDVLEYARTLLARSPDWRRRWPAMGRCSPVADADKLKVAHELVKELGDALGQMLSNPAFAARFLSDTARAYLRASSLDSGR